jgi:hypothetical protein
MGEQDASHVFGVVTQIYACSSAASQKEDLKKARLALHNTGICGLLDISL